MRAPLMNFIITRTTPSPQNKNFFHEADHQLYTTHNKTLRLNLTIIPELVEVLERIDLANISRFIQQASLDFFR